MPTATVSIDQFITDNRIVSGAFRVDENPNMADSHDMDHWKVTLTRCTGNRERRRGDIRKQTLRMTVYVSQGYGHNGREPKTADVLDCLSSDAASIGNTDFEMWCNDLGYDSDSRKAEKTYKACEHSARRLRNFLGDELYEQLLWNVEEL